MAVDLKGLSFEFTSAVHPMRVWTPPIVSVLEESLPSLWSLGHCFAPTELFGLMQVTADLWVGWASWEVFWSQDLMIEGLELMREAPTRFSAKIWV